MKLCEAVAPGRKNQTKFGCLKSAGHRSLFHLNGRGQMWRDGVDKIFNVCDAISQASERCVLPMGHAGKHKSDEGHRWASAPFAIDGDSIVAKVQADVAMDTFTPGELNGPAFKPLQVVYVRDERVYDIIINVSYKHPDGWVYSMAGSNQDFYASDLRALNTQEIGQ